MKALEEVCDNNAGEYVHYGSTSNDIIDSSQSLQLLPTKIHLVKAMVFPVVMYGCESWTVKKAER